MENFQCHQHTLQETFKLGRPKEAAVHYPPLTSSSKSDHQYVRFEYIWLTEHRYFTIPEETPQLPLHIQTVQGPQGFISTAVKRLDFLNDDVYAHRLVDSLISGSRPRTGVGSVESTVSKARRVLEKHHDDCETVLITLETIHSYMCFENLLVRRAMEESSGDRSGMTPASKSSMELLKRVDMEKCKKNDEESCAVCLEDFGMSDEDVFRMPCSHMFHGNCIFTWLNNSHFCPLCRFEMPTD